MKYTYKDIDDVFQNLVGLFDESQNEEMIMFLSGIKITASPPIKDLYKFKGELLLPNKSEKLDLSLKNFLHWGSTLKNSIKIDALVVYTGVDTKLVINVGTPKTKFSRAKILINYMALLYIIICLALTTFISIKGLQFNDRYGACVVVDHPEKTCGDVCSILSLKCSIE